MRKRYLKMKMGECTCDNCGVKFEKPLKELVRSEKLGRKNFCSRTCVGKNNIKNFGDKRSDYDITQHSGHKRDEYTGFRDFMRRIKRKDYEHNIDLAYLKEVWDKCNVCVYSGVELVLPTHRKNNNPLITASIDRIDSSKGYVKGNIQFISITANHAKNSMSHEQMMEFCNLIKENKKPII